MKKSLTAMMAAVALSLFFCASAMAWGSGSYGLDEPNYSVPEGSITQAVRDVLNGSSSASASNGLSAYEKMGEGFGTILLFSIPLIVALAVRQVRKQKK